MKHALRTILQLLIVLMWGFLFWRYRHLPWGVLVWQGAFFAGLLLMVSSLGSRFVQPDYVVSPIWIERGATLLCIVGLGLPLLMWSPWPLLVLPLWWGLLMAYLAHPAGSNFPGLKQHFRELGQQTPDVAISFKRAVLAAAFFPVFVPKTVWIWGFLVLAMLWMAHDYTTA